MPNANNRILWIETLRQLWSDWHSIFHNLQGCPLTLSPLGVLDNYPKPLNLLWIRISHTTIAPAPTPPSTPKRPSHRPSPHQRTAPQSPRVRWAPASGGRWRWEPPSQSWQESGCQTVPNQNRSDVNTLKHTFFFFWMYSSKPRARRVSWDITQPETRSLLNGRAGFQAGLGRGAHGTLLVIHGVRIWTGVAKNVKANT